MRVNSFHKVFTHKRLRVVVVIAMSLSVLLLLAAFINGSPKADTFSKRVNLAIRAIGHELLLRGGDSTSLVLPVTEKSTGVFLLQFENEFIFQPDTLVAIAQRVISKTALSKYTVTVHACHKSDIVYGFEINPPVNNIKACSGRHQPKACYNIEIAFIEFPDDTVSSKPTFVMISIILSVLTFVLIGRNVLSSQPKQDGSGHNDNQTLSRVGKFAFDTTHQCLKIGEETIALTVKEYKILTLLNRNIGQLTSRDALIQEVWTDEGVITGRSLDMFISKLRKKLSADPGIRITNIHGKGYRLEIVK